MKAAPTTLIARTLLRAWLRHPLRALAAMVGVVVGVALTTLVVAIDDSVTRAVRAVNGTGIVKASFAVRARSAAGLDEQLAQELRSVAYEAAPGARVTRVRQVSTGLAGTRGRGDDVLSVLGVEQNAEHFVPRSLRGDLVQTDARRGAPGLLVGERWLDSHGYGVGDLIELTGPDGASPWTVVGAIPGELPNGGAIAAGDLASVGYLFGRPDTVDALYVKVPAGVDGDAAATKVRAAAGAAAAVGPIDVVGETGARSLAIVRAMLLVAGAIGLLSAMLVVFVCWRLLLEDERTSIARFRLTGATPAQLAGGAGALVLGATALCCAFGVPAGLLAERSLRGFTAQLIGYTGLAAAPAAGEASRAAAAGIGGALAIACVAWGAGVRAFVRTPVIEAVRPPDPPPPPPTPRYAYAAAGGGAIVLAALSLTWLPFDLAGVGIALTVVGALLVVYAVPSLAGELLRGRSGFVAMAAGRHLTADSRRAAAVVLMVGTAMAAGLTLGGVANSYGSAIDGTVRSWTRADLYVSLGRPGETLLDARFSPRVRRRLARLPGVAQAGGVSFASIDHEGRNVMLQAYDTEHVADIADPVVHDGPRGAALWSALDAGQVAISRSMARLDSLEVGEAVSIPTRSASRRFEVVAVVDDYVADGGAVIGSMETFTRVTGDRRLGEIPLRLEEGASSAAVAAEVRRALPAYRSSLAVLDRAELRSIVAGFVTDVVAVFRGLALAVLLMVLVAATLTLGASLAVRRRSLAIAQVCGAAPRDVKAQVCIEAVAMAVCAWAVAAVVTGLLIPGTLRAMAAQTGLLPPVEAPVSELAVALPLGVGVALVAALLVARMTLRQQLVETLRFE